ncbi:MAG: HAD hydrolase-like protein [Gammaproteobacteria bacterium]|nr:HAD hydrolase-like protein [Gammaproteobacteria bacterium]MYC99863.1 HAD hydrolase-like protein [Gammaproteobacteria bacterium]MYF60362.1 HAD hydrolase-like protein [Gammaproteobacteria bacterium]
MVKRLILFDIDGTLVWGGPAKEAFTVALAQVFGATPPANLTLDRVVELAPKVIFAGRTDPQIARELLRRAGLDDDRIDEGLPRLWTLYPRELERRLPANPVTALAGVPELLAALEHREDVAMGLVTGNIREGARLKLGSAGLAADAFPAGGFGCDRESRNHLPAVAVGRAEQVWGVRFPPESVVVVGDTPLDVECGRHFGARTFAVATGHFGAAELEATGADHVAPDLTRTREVVDVLMA